MGPEPLLSNGFPGDAATAGLEQRFDNHCSSKPEGSPVAVEKAEAQRGFVVWVVSPH